MSRLAPEPRRERERRGLRPGWTEAGLAGGSFGGETRPTAGSTCVGTARCDESERPDFGVVASAGGSSGPYRMVS
eukprot:8201430-Alexandrium_andersonii.AAC.1